MSKIKDKSNTRPTVKLEITYSNPTTAKHASTEIQAAAEARAYNSLSDYFHVMDVSLYNNTVVVTGDKLKQQDIVFFEIMAYLHGTLMNNDDWLECVTSNPLHPETFHHHFWVNKQWTYRLSGTSDKSLDLRLGGNPVLESRKVREKELALQKQILKDSVEVPFAARCSTCSAFNPDDGTCDGESALGVIECPDDVVCKCWWPDDHYMEVNIGTNVYEYLDDGSDDADAR